jgi:hypothetical protein
LDFSFLSYEGNLGAGDFLAEKLLKENHHLPDEGTTKRKAESKVNILKGKAVALFLVPDWGIKSVMASGCRTGQPSYKGWRARYNNPTP